MQAGESTYEIDARESSGAPPRSALTIRTRSVLGAMAYAAQGIAVHQDELEYGSAAPNALAELAQWPLLEVRSSDTEPADAFVALCLLHPAPQRLIRAAVLA